MKKSKKKVQQNSTNQVSATAVRKYKELVKQYSEQTIDPNDAVDEGTSLINPNYEADETVVEKDVNDLSMVVTEHRYTRIAGLSEKGNAECKRVLASSNTAEDRTGDNSTLQIQADHFQEAIDQTQQRLSEVEDINKVGANEEYLELQERVQGLTEAKNRTLEQRDLEEVREIQKEDIGRLEIFKEWIKGNWLGVSTLAITVASLLTTIIIGARTAAVKGAQATK